ncbi:hypothetical protein KFK09_028516 [Dendrobium nobile]|uniref:Uncharacterized protein n=1 Tax=Dendrobium nobile TaxID=94219 RepID=A0A8T3A3B1_DENNO|nr:hypothetical protein KFK09_028516 [Dendrobium nobile]
MEKDGMLKLTPGTRANLPFASRMLDVGLPQIVSFPRFLFPLLTPLPISGRRKSAPPHLD